MASLPAINPGDSRLLRFPERRTKRRLTVSTETLAGYSTIQDAINHASAGDTIFVDAGIYIENLVIDKPVHLVGPADPRFPGDELESADDLPYALVIGTAQVTIDWSAPGGSITDVVISRASAADATSLVRMDSGRLRMNRCVIADGAHTAVTCHGGELTLERCHIRDTEVGIWATGGSVEMVRTHVEGPGATAVNLESAATISMTDACLEGRTLLIGDVLAFEGNDLDVVFMCQPVAVGNNRISSLVHLCSFQTADEISINL